MKKKHGSIKRTCLTCRQIFFVFPCQLKASKCIYCSSRCYGLAMRGRKDSEETKARRSKSLMGHAVSDELRKKMSINQKGKTPWNKGKKCPQYSGEKHWNWQGGITSDVKKRTNDIEWKKLAKSIYKRDSWCCRRCEKHIHSNPQCHHLVPFKIHQNNHPSNLITLCASCHVKIEHNWFMYLQLFNLQDKGVGVTII